MSELAGQGRCFRLILGPPRLDNAILFSNSVIVRAQQFASVPGQGRSMVVSPRDSHKRRPATTDDSQGLLPGLLANKEMAKRSNPAPSKPVIWNSPSRL
jgi:hypothetical protein